MSAERRTESGAALASQPTLSRFENNLSRCDLWQLSEYLVQHFIAQCRRQRRRAITLDHDATDDPTHGQQVFSGFHGYFGQRMYHPLLVFDGRGGGAPVHRVAARGSAGRAPARASRVIIKAEYRRAGPNTRFVVTSWRWQTPRAVYDAYVRRGQAENFIKELKSDLAADRLSCHEFLANQGRRRLYGLGCTLLLVPCCRLLKLSAWVSKSRRRVWVRFASAFPLQDGRAWCSGEPSCPCLRRGVG